MALAQDVTLFVRWCARIWGTAGAILWGAVFVATLPWFMGGGAMTMPIRLWLLQAAHGLIVLALLSAWRYELVGGTLALCASVAFFAAHGEPLLLPLFLFTASPAIAFMVLGMRHSSDGTAPRTAD